MIACIFVGLSIPGCRGFDPGPAKPPAEPVTGTLRVGTSGDYPPFSHWRSGDVEPVGFSVDVARAYATGRGRSVEWVRFRWPELTGDLERHRFDLVLSGVTVRADRSVAGRFSLPLTTSGAVALVEGSSDLRTPSDLERPGLQLAVNAGGHLERVARTLLAEARIHPVDRNENVLGHLGRSGIEAVMTDTLEAPIWRSKRPGLRVIGPLTRDRKAAWFPKASATEIRRFDDWLIRAEAEGLLADLRRTHGLPEARTADLPRALLAALDERLSLMTGVARAKRTLGAAVEDPTRERRVLDSASAAVRRAAVRNGIPAPQDGAIRRLYRAQIEAAKWIQRNWLDSRNPGAATANTAAQTSAQANLDESLRPALIFLGDRIATLIVRTTDDRLSNLVYEDIAAALTRHGLPEAHLHALHEALAGIATHDRSPPPSKSRRPSNAHDAEAGIPTS
ncbi:MAG: transporter substrate-binding domain-containing protein [bacterium]|nr:hypothetical protein [Deltaproteobacteria bacterium]MCP4903420.1 transporter substrate-binding domain-containing protein [bacterium]